MANVPINTERRAGSTLSFIDPSLVAGIAVNKGVSSTFYGSGALGGVVDLNYKLDEPTRFSLSQSSFANEKAISMTGSDDNLSYGIAYRQAQNEKDLNNNPLLSQFKQASSFINWQFQWQQGRTQEKLNLADISPAEHDLTLTHQANSFKMSLKYRYRLAKSDISTSEQVLEKAHIFSIRADSYLGENVQISLAIENIFNENYLTTADELANLMPDRHINLSLSYTL